VALLATIGGILALTWKSEPKLEGTLEAVSYSSDHPLPPRFVKPDPKDVDPDTTKSVLEELEGKPILFTGHSMRLRFRSDLRRGMEVTVEAAAGMQVVKVELRQNAFLSRFLSQHEDEFEKLRQAELRPALRKFFTEHGSANAAMSSGDTNFYHHSLAVPAMTSGTGYVVEAVVGKTGTRCVYEDDQRRLFFLLPRNVKSFVLAGRKLDDGRVAFPGRYTCQIAESQEPEPAKPEMSKPAEEEEVDGLAPKKKPGKKTEKPESEEKMEPSDSGK
jgi:hypothetical protein